LDWLVFLPCAVSLLLAPHRWPSLAHRIRAVPEAMSFFADGAMRLPVHRTCIKEAVAGTADLLLCGLPLVLLLLTGYRLPRLFATIRAFMAGGSACELRKSIWVQACLVFLDVGVVMLLAVLAVLCAWRVVPLLAAFRRREDTMVTGWRRAVSCQAALALLDVPCFIAGAIIFATGYRAPLLLAKLRAHGGYFSLKAQMIVLREAWELLLDLPFLFMGLVVVVTLVRSWDLFITRWAQEAPVRRQQVLGIFLTLLADLVTLGPLLILTVTVYRVGPVLMEMRRLFGTKEVVIDASAAKTATSLPPDQGRRDTSPSAVTFSTQGARGVDGKFTDVVDLATWQDSLWLRLQPHIVAWIEFLELLLDLPFLALAALVLCSWRCPTLMHHFRTMPPLGSDSRANWQWRAEVLRCFLLVLSDLIVIGAMLLVALLVLRLPSLARRASMLLRGRRRDSSSSTTTTGDLEKSLAWACRLDGMSTAAEVGCLSLLQFIVFEELLYSIASLPQLLLAPVASGYLVTCLIERYARWRLRLATPPAVTSLASPGMQTPCPTGCNSRPESRPPSPTDSSSRPPSPGPICSTRSFFLTPVPWLLALAPSGTNLWEVERHVMAHLCTLICLLLNELALLLAVLLAVLVFIPLTFGNGLCPAWSRWRWLLSGVHVLQALTALPLMVLGLLLLHAPAVVYLCLAVGIRREAFGVELLQGSTMALGALAEAPWVLWLCQVVWILVFAGAAHLLAIGPLSRGAYRPCRGAGVLAAEACGTLTGHSLIWTHGLDPLLGAGVRCCYRHRRTCGCLGELGLALQLFIFLAWPLLLPFLCAPTDSTRLIIWWISAAAVLTFLLVHGGILGLHRSRGDRWRWRSST